MLTNAKSIRLLSTLILLTLGASVFAEAIFYPVNDGEFDPSSMQVVATVGSCQPPFAAVGGSTAPDLGDEGVAAAGGLYTSIALLSFDTTVFADAQYRLHLAESWSESSAFDDLGNVILEYHTSDSPVPDWAVVPDDVLGAYTYHGDYDEASFYSAEGIDITSMISAVLADVAHHRYLFLRMRFAGCNDGDDESDRTRINMIAGDPERVHISGASAGLPVIDATLAGSWWNPLRNGEGFVFDIFENDDGDTIVVVYFYTYANDGSGAPIYLVGAAPVNGSTAQIEVVRTSGGAFGSHFDPAQVAMPVWGTLTVTFVSCSQIDVSYDSPDYGAGTLSVERLAEVGKHSNGICAL